MQQIIRRGNEYGKSEEGTRDGLYSLCKRVVISNAGGHQILHFGVVEDL